MINPKEAPLYKGFLKIFLFFLLAMVGGFLGGELRALKADALTSSVPPPRSAAQGPWMPALAFPESSPPQTLAILRAHDRRARALPPIRHARPPPLPPESAVVPPLATPISRACTPPTRPLMQDVARSTADASQQGIFQPICREA